jgi:hypothetical protein
MNSKGVIGPPASQTRTSTRLKFIDNLCLFAPLVIFLAVLGWAMWGIRLVSPIAFGLFAGLMIVVLALGIVGIWPRLSGRLLSAPAVSAKQLDPFYEVASLTSSVTVAAIDREPKAF